MLRKRPKYLLLLVVVVMISGSGDDLEGGEKRRPGNLDIDYKKEIEGNISKKCR